jgi:3-phosphoshikimate 1-carboxyvinyltransferase
MPDLIIRPSAPLRGTVAIPGDKSITHRAIILGGLAEGQTDIIGWVPAEVCLATLRCVEALGVRAEETRDSAGAPVLRVTGVGLRGLAEPEDVLHCAGSGTTIRLMAGVLAGQPFTSVLTGTEPLRRRPMGRVADPLRQMGATIFGRQDGRLAPLTIRGGNLRAIRYAMPVASAQVKSAILLAGLFAAGDTTVIEPGPSRDHTERMLRAFGVEVSSGGGEVSLAGDQTLRPPPGGTVVVPGDFSSAAFPLVAASIVPGSEVRLQGVGLNRTRTGLLDLLLAMGASLAPSPPLPLGEGRGEGGAGSNGGEPAGELRVLHAPLDATEAAGDLIVRAIDEFPIFAVAATQAHGSTVVREAAELRVKESDRIATVAGELRTMGAQVDERPDGMVIHGPTRLHGAVVQCHRDHRLAMSLAVAGLVAEGETVVRGAEAIDDSFPGFVETMQALGADIRWR